MKRKLTAMLVVVILFVPACTTTYDLTSTPQDDYPWAEQKHRTYGDFLARAEGKTVRIVLTSGREILGTVTRADTDSVGWTEGKEVTTEDPGGWMKPAEVDDPTRKDSAFFSTGLVSTSRVQRLEITYNYHLWWLGSLVVVLATTIPAVAHGDWEPQGTMHGKDYSGRTAIMEVGIFGALVGGLATGFIYHSDEYLTGTQTSADTRQSR